MKKSAWLILLLPASVAGQVSLNTIGAAYTENFNSLPNVTDGSALATWTNNTTLTGWYIEETAGAADDKPVIEASCGPAGTNVNNGGSSYIIASGSDRSLGSRPAGSTGTIYTGVRLVNNTGSTITSLFVRYTGEQWSIAENVNSGSCTPYCINSLTFDYQVNATALNSGTWTNDPSLTFTQLHNCTLGTCTGSSAQRAALDGNLSSNQTTVSSCITVTINNGEEIWLRWSDVDNGANDHHLQIDNLEVWPFDIACSTILPIELLSFNGRKNGSRVLLDWSTATETNNHFFTIERSVDGQHFDAIGRLDGAGNSAQVRNYQFTDETPHSGINYYRLRQTDFNGQTSTSSIVPVVMDHTHAQLTVTPGEAGETILTASGLADGNASLRIYDTAGRLLVSKEVMIENGFARIPVNHFPGKGIFFATLTGEGSSLSARFMR